MLTSCSLLACSDEIDLSVSLKHSETFTENSEHNFSQISTSPFHDKLVRKDLQQRVTRKSFKVRVCNVRNHK